MQTSTALPGSLPVSLSQASVSHPWMMLISRSGLFLIFQGLIALVLLAAFFTGLVVKLRPSLLPYFVVVHALLDVTTVLVYVMI